jgi:membrane protein implicated in regulation of membrane protease activity
VRTDVDVEGALGVVCLRIKGGASPGEVRVAVRGTFETFIAYCDEELAAGTEVLIFNSRGPRSVDVMRAPPALRGNQQQP